MKHTRFFSVLCFIMAVSANAQQSIVIRGMEAKLRKQTIEDTNRVWALDDLAWEYSYFDFNKSNEYCRRELALSKKINYLNGQAMAYSTMGNNYRALNHFDSAHYYLDKALEIRKNQNRKDRISAVLVNIANIYAAENNYLKAILTYDEAIKAARSVDFKAGALSAYTNLADAYRTVELLDKAMEALNTALSLSKVLKDSLEEPYLYVSMAALQGEMGNTKAAIAYGRKALKTLSTHPDINLKASVFNNLGNYYRDLKLFDSSSISYQRALIIERMAGDSAGVGVTSNGLAILYHAEGKYDESLNYAEYARSIAKSVGDSALYNKANMNMALAYIAKKNYNKALTLALEARSYAEKLHVLSDMAEVYSRLATIYKGLGMYGESSNYLEKVIYYRDSVISEKNNRTAAALNIEFDIYGKEKEIELLNKTFEVKEAELSKQKSASIFIACIAMLFALIGLVVIFFYRRIKKASLIIQKQKQQVEIQNEEISSQKSLIEAKQNDIISSINYAQRIQSAILTGEEIWNRISKKHFILYHPRDIVSGDFYWAHVLPNGRAVFTLADCTGHGVPGGFMSMLGNSFLNELVVENKLFKADEILNRLRDKVIHALEQKGETSQKDGMDMALCVWNKLENTLEFAGANNGMCLVRAGQLTIYKGDKMPIGSYLDTHTRFTSQVLQLQPDDMIYLVTDGFADQFGGKEGKKFKYKHLEDLLIKVSTMEISDQKQYLDKVFIEWKDNYEQTDDMSLIGIKI
jgi:serine phosphatase RsbU (regulator of sigma subunit)